MGQEHQGDRPAHPSPREEVAAAGGPLDTDDATQADQGIAGGSGAAPEEGTRQPLATDPLADEDEHRHDR